MEVIKINIEEKWINLSKIPEFENFTEYSVSNFGNVKSFKIDKKNGKSLKPRIRNGRAGKPYLRVVIYDDNCQKKQISIHRLVLLAFDYIDNHKEMTVDHINEVTDDNRFTNLQWLTSLENIKKSSKKRRKFSDEINNEIKRKYKSGEFSYNKLSKEYKSSLDTIWRIVNKF